MVTAFPVEVCIAAHFYAAALVSLAEMAFLVLVWNVFGGHAYLAGDFYHHPSGYVCHHPNGRVYHHPNGYAGCYPTDRVYHYPNGHAGCYPTDHVYRYQNDHGYHRSNRVEEVEVVAADGCARPNVVLCHDIGDNGVNRHSRHRNNIHLH